VKGSAFRRRVLRLHRFPVPSWGDRAGGSLVPAVRAVVPRSGGSSGGILRARLSQTSNGHGCPLVGSGRRSETCWPAAPGCS